MLVSGSPAEVGDAASVEELASVAEEAEPDDSPDTVDAVLAASLVTDSEEPEDARLDGPVAVVSLWLWLGTG